MATFTVLAKSKAAQIKTSLENGALQRAARQDKQ